MINERYGYTKKCAANHLQRCVSDKHLELVCRDELIVLREIVVKQLCHLNDRHSLLACLTPYAKCVVHYYDS